MIAMLHEWPCLVLPLSLLSVIFSKSEIGGRCSDYRSNLSSHHKNVIHYKDIKKRVRVLVQVDITKYTPGGLNNGEGELSPLMSSW